jgi:hypothetical protein
MSDEVVELIQAESETLCSEAQEVINSIWNLPDQWKVPIIIPIYKRGYETNFIN